jgi:DNA adenine methylase
MSRTCLNPIFKWTGGKRREIVNFEKFFPSFINEKYRYVEPFVGGGAVFFHLNNIDGENVINDFDPLVINFYKEFVKQDPAFISRVQAVGEISDHNLLEYEYYRLRDWDRNGGLALLTGAEKALRFFVVNQLAFSGMRRFNSRGEFNVPFGHYKRLNANVITSLPHRLLLQKTSLLNKDFEEVMKDNDLPRTFIFLDPPYTRVFKKYSFDNSFGEQDHIRLARTIKRMNLASVLMVIDKSDLTLSLYNGYIRSSYSLKYGVNIKNRFGTDVEHLVICNY